MSNKLFEWQLAYCQTYARDDGYIYCEDCTSCDCCRIDPDHPPDKSLEYCEDFEYSRLIPQVLPEELDYV